MPGNASTYGDNAVENKGGAWKFIADTGNAWYDARLKAGKTPAQVDAYLAQFDVWDRYDYDSDGDFNEPDGYLDHFQAVHAGGGEDGGFGEDAIWSHRWYVNGDLDGKVGPAVGSARNLSGGARIGQSKYFIGDYTVEPENGGLGVFTHEFGHDLGLPDFYDTTNTGENSTGFWTLMSAGSWLSHGHENGTTPSLMGPEEKALPRLARLLRGEGRAAGQAPDQPVPEHRLRAGPGGQGRPPGQDDRHQVSPRPARAGTPGTAARATTAGPR
ncbi:immune inhibitor A domain-containing protein [Nocardioides convexus]|uniref:immune inhibitor A domain-containing protein n=1 Tax=Nocardioides convexus TaxID=2712224 RepID=UPI0024187CEC|nr:immune inhibitor A domain-containing protein [Nocardioides convexus]